MADSTLPEVTASAEIPLGTTLQYNIDGWHVKSVFLDGNADFSLAIF